MLLMGLLLIVLLGGCGAPSKAIIVPVQPPPRYDPCFPPVGNAFPDGPADPFYKGYGWDGKPTACL